MENDLNEENKNFFQKVKISILGVDKYSEYLKEKFSKAFKYFMILILLATLIVGGILYYTSVKEINTAVSYIRNELPNFKIENNQIISEKNVDAYDSNYDFKFVVNTDENLDSDKIKEIENDMYNYFIGVFITRDNIEVFYPVVNEDSTSSVEYSMTSQLLSISDVISYINTISSDTNLAKNTTTSENVNEVLDTNVIENNVSTINESNYNKEFLVSYIDSILSNVYLTFGLVIFIIYFLAFFIKFVFDVFVLSIIGEVYNSIVDLKIEFSKIFSLSIYSMTLSILVYAIVNALSIYTSCSNEIVNSLYFIIGIIYIIAALSIMKSNDKLAKQDIGAFAEIEGNINSIDLKDDEENHNQEENKKDDKKDDDTKENEEKNKKTDEPDGSEI